MDSKTDIKYELIDYASGLPIKIFTQTVQSFPYHWHKEIELIMVLKNKTKILLGDNAYDLHEGDLFVVNKNEIHSIRPCESNKPCELLVLQFDIDEIAFNKIKNTNLFFKINNKENETEILELKKILARMLNISINKPPYYKIYLKKCMMDLILIFHFFFITNKKDDCITYAYKNEKLNNIILYIHENYSNSELNLNSIAIFFNITPQYLSKFFKQNIGTSLIKYLNILRFDRSLNTLLETDDTILEVALKHGFPNSKSYYKTFSDILGTTPTKFRSLNKIKDGKKVTGYFDINHSDSLNKIFKLLAPTTNYNKNKENQSKIFENKKAIKNHVINIKNNNIVDKFSNSFKEILCFGHASYALRHDFYTQLKTIQNEIGFKYVRFHGIFCDELLVCNKDINGNLFFNFNHIDSVLNVFKKTNIKPFIEIGFMPKLLASANKQIFQYSSYVSKPTNINDWLLLLKSFFTHIINKYGEQEILSWKFEFWNEPEYKAFWDNSKEEFFSFFLASYKCIKSINENIQIGGFGNVINDNKWLIDFIEFCKKENIQLDFGTFHIYPVKTSFDKITKEKKLDVKKQAIGSNSNIKSYYDKEMIIGEKEHFNCLLEEWKKVFTNKAFGNKLYITEFNSTPLEYDLTHDTCFMAAFLVKTILNSYNKLDGIGYWTFTDLMNEFVDPQPIFHGGFGLITYNGLKKAGYYAYYFLNKLKENIIYKDDFVVVTKDDSSYQILMYNYVHYNDLYKRFDFSQISKTNRYNVFEAKENINVNINIELPFKNYRVSTYTVNENFGSSYDNWVSLGAPDILTTDMYDYLKNISVPKLGTYLNNDSNFTTNHTLLSHEVTFISIERIMLP